MVKLEICKNCLKPKEDDLKCDYCGSEETATSRKYYSIKQWEYFIDSLKGGALHDFHPWEFNEDDGSIKERVSYSGPTEPTQTQKVGNNRKTTKGRNQHKKKSTRKKKKHGHK